MPESDEEKYIKKLNEESIPTGICLFNDDDDEDDGTYYE